MAWNSPNSPLHAGVLPSFLYGRGAHNWWLTHEVLSSEMRLVFDASSLVLGLYPESFSSMYGMSSSKSERLPAGSWEYSVNCHLAAIYGSYCYPLPRKHSTVLHKVVKQSEDYLFSKVDELTLSDFVISKGKAHGGGGSLWRNENICLSGHLHSSNLPHSLSMLLELAADNNRSVVLGVAGISYSDLLMSWACRLRHLKVTNFIVCALDHETYEFSVLQVVIFNHLLSSLKKITSFLLQFFIFNLFTLQTTDHLKSFNPNSRVCQFSEIHYHQRTSALMTATLEQSVFN